MGDFLSSPRPFHQRVPDLKSNGVEFPAHLMIPEPERLDASRRETAFAFDIVPPLIRKTMSASIEFDGEPRFHTVEIEEVIAARILAAEFEVAKAAVAQQAPETFLGVGGLPAESTREFTGGGSSCAPDTPHPCPLPSEGRGDARAGLRARGVRLVVRRIHSAVLCVKMCRSASAQSHPSP